jgi:putative flippase GtrA
VSTLATLHRTARYTTIGAISAATHNAVMILGALAGGGYASLSVLSFAIVTPLGYLLQSRFTFRAPVSWGGFARFASGVAAGIPLYAITMIILCSGLHVPIIAAAPLTTLVLFLWNYVSAHWAILLR